MPRAPDGSYSLPSGTLVNSGDTILPSQHNPAMQDIAQALSNSLDRNGSGGMRAPLNMGGNQVRNALAGSSDTDLATVAQSISNGVPIGAVLDFAGSMAPAGFLLCFGQAISRTDYADLFAAIGTAFGSGDGATTFNVPDMRGRVGAGKDDMGGTSAARLNTLSSTALGASGGSQTHSLTFQENGAHNHFGTTGAAGGHIHSGRVGADFGNYPGGINSFEDGGGMPNWLNGPMGEAGVHTHTIPTDGSGQPHNNVQPTMIFNKIIKASKV